MHISYIRWVIKIFSETKSENEFEVIWKLLSQKSYHLNWFLFEVFERWNNWFWFLDSLWFDGALFVGNQKRNNSLEAAINKYLKVHWIKGGSKSTQKIISVMEKSFGYYITKCNEESACQMIVHFFTSILKSSLFIWRKIRYINFMKPHWFY